MDTQNVRERYETLTWSQQLANLAVAGLAYASPIRTLASDFGRAIF